ncbi:MAG: hypothetical protein R2824_04740 [Saprospiraceae bacterium]|nr:hypothetical protein [Lewinella sp.]
MSQFRIHILLQQLTKHQVLSFLWRLLLPLALIMILPAAENILQKAFLAEGIFRVFCRIWSFRGPMLLAFRSAGIGVFAFMLEESLQELIFAMLL